LAWPPTGFLIFFTNKNLLSLFWLEIWWDVVKHPNTPFLQLGEVRGYRLTEKWLEPQENEIRGFCPFGHPTKK